MLGYRNLAVNQVSTDLRGFNSLRLHNAGLRDRRQPKGGNVKRAPSTGAHPGGAVRTRWMERPAGPGSGPQSRTSTGFESPRSYKVTPRRT